jgi:RecQ family ATP-dependent DNA helicase
MLWTDKVKKILSKYFNNIELKDKQIDVINELLSGNDVIGLLPTGYGKSMCYIIPPLITKKTIFVISPLISLMEDQKDNLFKKNIIVATLHCNNKNKQEEIFKIIDGDVKIVYMSPEYLIEGDGIDLALALIDKNMLGFLAVDESHCISSWGHDFRPNYLKLKMFREQFKDIPILALTATAKGTVVDEIVKLLNLTNPKIISTSFDRPNLHIICKEMPKVPKLYPTGSIMKKKGQIVMTNIDKWIIVQDYIKKYPNDKIIIYVNSRADTEELANDINNNLHKCSVAYHAGLSKNIRDQVQNEFNEDKIKVIISTIAFGMGIDQIVRCVLIFGCPSSIEEYYQQIGRGGRDGLYCETVLFFDMAGFMRSKSMIDREIKNPKLKNIRLSNIDKVCYYYKTDTCRRKYILNYFGQESNGLCDNCDNCLYKKSIKNKKASPVNSEIELVDPFDKINDICKKIGLDEKN